MVFLRTLLISSLLCLPFSLYAEGPAPLPFDDPNYTPPVVTPQPLTPAGDASGEKPDCKTVMVKKSRHAKPVAVTRCSKPARSTERNEARTEDDERHCKTVMVKKTRRGKAVAETRCSGGSRPAAEKQSERGSTASSRQAEADCKATNSRKGRKTKASAECAQSKHENTTNSRTKKGKPEAESVRKGKSSKPEKASKSKETSNKKKHK